MRLRELIICAVCIFLSAVLLIAAGLQLEPINRQRQEMDLVIDMPEDIPPSLIFATVATGAFRGLLVDILWIRADRLKEAGQFFDAKQLAEWITVLQPRFASVWEFHAWNMAYNISVAIPASQYEQRWRWVKNGYELIRDEAITKNKLNNIELYHELARIFQHKIGGVSDDAHEYYKIQLKFQMDPLLRSGDWDLTGEDNKYFDLLAETPDKWNDIIKDPNVAKFVNALKSSDSEFSDDEDFVGNYLALREYTGRFNEAAGLVIDDYRGTDVLKRFDIFARAYQLRKVWKLDPILMREINRTHGPIDWDDPNTHLPLDWRHADSHAMYWAQKGLNIAAQDSSRDISPAETNTDRIITHSLQNLFRLGKIIILEVPAPSDGSSENLETQMGLEVFLRPDLRYFKSYDNAVLKVMEKYNTEEEQGTYETLRNQYRNMLKNALLLFYQSGHKDQAQKIYAKLRQAYPEMEEFKIPLMRYAALRILEELEGLGYQDATEQVTALLKQGYYYYAIEDDEAAAGAEANAREIYDNYQAEYNDIGRIDLLSFNQLKALSLRDFVDDRQYPDYFIERLINRMYIQNREVYEQLVEEIEQIREKEKQE